ncbi:MAG: DNA primase large subunit PriL [Candidatus Bathyarchaeota archaeon]|nr:DNA primase large subunit PriL [Candidatus Bathyarchaeota archaeon]MDH5787820.1 DNA primase large subunit PriL [Candidatus Bathyarchaeota archaeon]
MRYAFSKLAKNDYAKYPFLKAAIKYVQIPDLRIQDLADSNRENILKRAQQRLEEAIFDNIVSRDLHHEDIEIISFPVAVMLAMATKNSFIQKRYALAEANQTYEDLRKESEEKTLEVAKNFGWELASNKESRMPYRFALNLVDYLRNTTHLREKPWKLVNRMLSNGNVYLGIDEVARLLKEEVRRHIEKRLELKELPAFPPKITEIAEKIRKLSEDTIGKTEMEGFPKAIVQVAFPPCIKALYESFSSGRHLSHVGRFTLTSFLINIGMPPETVVEFFKSFSDYNERMTRYQVEHIAGEKGSRTRYIPPKCDTLKTHGVCTNPDELCQRMRHPLSYYRIKVKAT